MSSDALAGMGPGLRALTVRGNLLEVLPDLRPLTGLEVVDLQDNPLLCDCALLPLRRSVQISQLLQGPRKLSISRIISIKIYKSHNNHVTVYFVLSLCAAGGWRI